MRFPQLLRVNASVVGGQPAGSVGKSRSQAVSPIEAATSSSGSRSEQNTDMDVVTELRDPRAPGVKRKMTSSRDPEE